MKEKDIHESSINEKQHLDQIPSMASMISKTKRDETSVGAEINVDLGSTERLRVAGRQL